MRLPRFTVRRLMVAIAVIAFFLATGLLLNDRRGRFALLANDHGLKAIEAKRPARHLALYEKYIDAAHHPWLPVADDPPDPPEPE